jgi:hypothetical protein
MFTLHGKQVAIRKTTDIPREYLPSGYFAPYVQMILDSIEPWKGDRYIVRTLRTRRAKFPTKVTRVGDLKRFWAIHVAFAPQDAGIVPFVYIKGGMSLSKFLTLELDGTMDDPELICVYPGRDQPPLPWMLEDDADVEESREFWLTHAYILYNKQLIVPGTQTTVPPVWAR